MKIAVIGTGYVGLVTGACLAKLGHHVQCADINEMKINHLKKGKIPFYEPGLKELVKQVHKQLQFTTDIPQSMQWADIVINAVGTPPGKDHRADLSAVKAVAQQFGQSIEKHTVFVNKSTVPVGTSAIVTEIIQKALKKKSTPFDVVDNPEFLREGSAIQDFLKPDRIVVGLNTPRAKPLMKKLYKKITQKGVPLFFTDIHSAEVIKYAANAFLATKISFINEIANFCETCDADVREVAKGIGLDKRIGESFLSAGIGYGGSCFPKDLKSLIQSGKRVKTPFQILEAVEHVNQRQHQQIIRKLQSVHKSLKGKTIAVWGATFKPNTDDMREAPSLKIIPSLIQKGAKIRLYDPIGLENAKKELGTEGITYCDSKESALKGAKALLILTEWDEFKEGIPQISVVIDGRNMFNPRAMKKAGIQYWGVGI